MNKKDQRSMKTAIKSYRPLVHFSNKGQKLGTILENKVPQTLNLPKNDGNKKCSPKLIFFNEKKIRKIRIIFDIEKCLKVRIWPFLPLLIK